MKIPSFKFFAGGVDQVLDYLKIEHALNLRELITALGKLRFTENFECFKVSVTIPASSEVAIDNKLRPKAIPTERLIVRGNSGSIVDGDTAWTENHVYMKNLAASSATVTIIFLK